MQICKSCEKEISIRNIFCNNKCQQDYMYTQYIILWKENKVSWLRWEYSISHYIVRYLLSKYNYKCSQCSWNEVNKVTWRSPLEVEHIDWNYLNNSEDNLTILCPNCHSLTPTYKSLNKGNGRKQRKKYT